ncbi:MULTISPECIES: hypothetical protein [Pseudomonas]|uniref:hypothetical protein n=1 Tax=Pseudomonas TaxID=286 RepID=UPI001597020B|nr:MULTISPECIES: hypothetical protein [Pseudomonas]
MEIGGVELAQQTEDALILAGLLSDEARALMGDHEFQQSILVQLHNIEQLYDETQSSTKAFADKWSAVELDPSYVSGERGRVQMALTYASLINEYLSSDPERAEKLTLALAMIQGPKAVIQLAVAQAIGSTDVGQYFNEQADRVLTAVGKKLAEKMEGVDSLDGKTDDDKFLIGGGKLVFSIIMGAVGGAKGVGAAGQKLPSALPDNLTGYANPKDIRFTQTAFRILSKMAKLSCQQLMG